MHSKRKITIAIVSTAILLFLLILSASLFDSAPGHIEEWVQKVAGGEKLHTVTFLSPTDEVLKIESVSTGDTAVPPASVIVQEGQVFSKWDAPYWNIEKDTKIKAECESYAGKKNVIALAGAYTKSGEMFRIPLQLCGEVELCGLNITICYDSQVLRYMELEQQDFAVMAGHNKEKGEIYLNYLSTYNTTGAVELGTLKFEAISTEVMETNIDVNLIEIIALDEKENFVESEYNIISACVQIYPQ